MSVTEYILLAVGALATSTVSGIAGVGGGMIYLPLLTEIVGVKSAVVYLSVLLLAGNTSRAWFSRAHIDWQVLGHFFLGAIPAALVGALFYTVLPAFWIKKALGLFLLSYVALGFTKSEWPKSATLRTMTWMGIPAGFTSAVVGGSGLIMAPFLLRYGLVKEAFLGTEAVAAASTHIAKIGVWGGAKLLTLSDFALLAPLSLFMIAGSYIGKRLVSRMRVRVFRIILLALMAIIGVRFLVF